MRLAPLLAAFCLVSVAAPAAAQMPDPAARIAEQRAAMARLSFLDGVWRGPAWSITPAGRRDYVQTERVGPFLDGAVRVVEGRAYDADGTVAFNALGVISFDPDTDSYALQTWAMGRSIRLPLQVAENRLVWEVPAGPGAVIRYSTTIADGGWREVGERIAGDAPPVPVVELDLRRVGDSDWPAAGAVPMR